MNNQNECAEEPRLCSTYSEARAKTHVSIETTQGNSSFETLFAEAVDEALSSLRYISKQTVYSSLEKAFNIRRQDIPYRIDDFADAIETIFGVGAKLIEIRIMKRIYEKIGPSYKYSPEGKDLIFTEYLNAAKAEFDERSTNAEAEVNKLPPKARKLSWKEQILKLA